MFHAVSNWMQVYQLVGVPVPDTIHSRVLTMCLDPLEHNQDLGCWKDLHAHIFNRAHFYVPPRRNTLEVLRDATELYLKHILLKALPPQVLSMSSALRPPLRLQTLLGSRLPGMTTSSHSAQAIASSSASTPRTHPPLANAAASTLRVRPRVTAATPVLASEALTQKQLHWSWCPFEDHFHTTKQQELRVARQLLNDAKSQNAAEENRCREQTLSMEAEIRDLTVLLAETALKATRRARSCI
ncbi:hypothetical protein B0H11DRAFT_2259675 [Mycena galericulata]|nr:hypothetical protein B0H11DRAFT_2259675 [Mycena galericulata]